MVGGFLLDLRRHVVGFFVVFEVSRIKRKGYKPATNKVLIVQIIFLLVPYTHVWASRRHVKLVEAEEMFINLQPNSELREISDRLCHQAGFSP